jgi:hypothetical protein
MIGARSAGGYDEPISTDLLGRESTLKFCHHHANIGIRRTGLTPDSSGIGPDSIERY